jgi:capsular polysaccharide biosynthesis protein
VEFWTAVGIIRKRWYVVVACAVVFGIAAAIVYRDVRPSYQASGTVVVLQTGQPTSHDAIPYNNPWGTPTGFVALLAPAAGDTSFEHAFYAAGGTGTYTVEASINNTPTLILTTTAPTPAEALKSYQILVTLLEKAIIDKQDQFNTPASARYVGTVNITPSRPAELVGSRIKALIVLGALGLMVTLGLVFLVDSTAHRAAWTRDLSLDEAIDLIDPNETDEPPPDDDDDDDDDDVIERLVLGSGRVERAEPPPSNGARVGASEAANS